RGEASPLLPAEPIREVDEYAGKPEASGLIHAADLSPPKPRMDVLLIGEIVFPNPIGETDVTLELGRRLRKTLRVFGDRTWRPGVAADLAPARPKPIARLPIAWEKSFGGTDPKDPTCIERRNPVGGGLRRDPGDLVGHPVP